MSRWRELAAEIICDTLTDNLEFRIAKALEEAYRAGLADAWEDEARRDHYAYGGP